MLGELGKGAGSVEWIWVGVELQGATGLAGGAGEVSWGGELVG